MNIKFPKWSVLPLVALLLGSAAVAQDQSSSGSTAEPRASSQPSAPAPAQKPTIRERKENQQDRIAQGVKSGQLTAGETANLETKEAAINGETKADRAANGGKITAAGKKQINKQQNQPSKKIHNDKHKTKHTHHSNNKS